MNLPTQVEIDRELCKRNLYEFVKHAWHIVEPQTEFVDGWHIEYLCKYLEAVYRGEIRNLIINVPPRHMKSLLVNVFFPAWVWANRGGRKFLYSSYGQDLANRDSIICKNLITSEWFQTRWRIKMQRGEDRKDYFANQFRGYRISFGVGGAVTGQGGDFLIGDDCLKAFDANSDAERKKVNQWWDDTFSTRASNPKTVCKILIMQRLHSDDLTGHLLESKEKWELVCLPAEYEGQKYISSIGLDDPRKEMGELLWEGRFGKEEIQSAKNSLSELGYAGQYQQRPSAVAGNIFKKKWFLNRMENTDIVERWISADTAESVNASADPNAIVVGELDSNYRLFIREVSNKRLEFPDLQAEIERLANKYKYNLTGIIIESKSSGISLQQSIQRTSPEWMRNMIYPFVPKGGKVQKFYQAAVWCEKDCIILPPHNQNFSWLKEFEDELFTVDNSKHDDQADAFSQLIIFLENYIADGFRERDRRK